LEMDLVRVPKEKRINSWPLDKGFPASPRPKCARLLSLRRREAP
jgi:hypothetical protein